MAHAEPTTVRNQRCREDLPPGWRPIYDRLAERFSTLDPVPEVLQVKEKLASLSVYLADWTPAAGEMIEEAKAEAEGACQVCGAPATLHNIDRVLSRLCPDHAVAKRG
jgi:hypothetical protein